MPKERRETPAASLVPATMVELYAMAIDTLLERIDRKASRGTQFGAATSEQVLGLLRRVALDAHNDCVDKATGKRNCGASGRKLSSCLCIPSCLAV